MMTGKEIIKHYEKDIINPGLDFILKNMRIMQRVGKGQPPLTTSNKLPGNTGYYAYFQDKFLKKQKFPQEDRRIYKTLNAFFDKAISKQIKAGKEIASRDDKSKLT